MYRVDVPESEWIDDPTRMVQVCREVRDVGRSGIDTETTGLDLAKDHVVVWSLSPSRDSRYCLSRQMLPIFRDELADDPNIIWDMTNCNFDNNMLANSGVPLLKGDIRCTLVMDWLYDENERHGLKDTSLRHLGLNMREFKKVFPRKRGEAIHEAILRVLETDPEKAWDYASLDAWASRENADFLQLRLERIEALQGISMYDLYENIEMPYHKVLYMCSRRGVMIDAGYLYEVSEKIKAKMDELHHKFNKKVGYEINLKSNPQLVDLFINNLKHDPVKWTSGGKSGNRKPSTDDDCLRVWAGEGCEFARLLIEYRALKKTEGTYCTGMINRADAGYRIHPMYTQSVAVTGRQSSRDPNLQNIPRPENDIWGLRSAFMPATNHVLLAADYKQLEMRLMAEMSGDERMRDVVRKDWDIHMGSASVMYGVPYEDIVKAKKEASILKDKDVPQSQWPDWVVKFLGYRQDAKALGFGQHTGRSKTCSKRGNLSAMHKAIPCCAARRSVSTCGDRQITLNGAPVFIGFGSHPRKISLTRQAKSNVAIRLTCMTAPSTCLKTLRRYSQRPEKSGTHALNYGKGVWALAQDLGITKQEAEDRIAKYFEPYPGVEQFIETTHEECRNTLEVQTILGRKRRLIDADADWKEGFYSRKYRKYIPERPGRLAARALRQSVNSIIQGSAADVARMAQLRIEGLDHWQCRESEMLHALGVRQILQIHDEILFEVPEESLDEACPLIQKIMTKPFADLPDRLGVNFTELSIPLDIDIGIGEAWSEAH